MFGFNARADRLTEDMLSQGWVEFNATSRLKINEALEDLVDVKPESLAKKTHEFYGLLCEALDFEYRSISPEEAEFFSASILVDLNYLTPNLSIYCSLGSIDLYVLVGDTPVKVEAY